MFPAVIFLVTGVVPETARLSMFEKETFMITHHPKAVMCRRVLFATASHGPSFYNLYVMGQGFLKEL